MIKKKKIPKIRVSGEEMYQIALELLGKSDEIAQRYREYYETLLLWMENKNNQRAIGEYFSYGSCRRIGIYGGGALTRLFLSELQDQNLYVDFIIDQYNRNERIWEVRNLSFDQAKEIHIDVFVIMVSHASAEVQERMRENDIHWKTLSIREIVEAIRDGRCFNQ